MKTLPKKDRARYHHLALQSSQIQQNKNTISNSQEAMFPQVFSNATTEKWPEKHSTAKTQDGGFKPAIVNMFKDLREAVTLRKHKQTME